MRYVYVCLLISLSFYVQDLLTAATAHSSVITVINLDGENEGFNDPAAANAASTAGGNSGITLGAQRLIAFQYAANIWAGLLSSPIEIKIDATLDSLTCSATSATLGAAGTRTVHRDFTGAPIPNTWYPQALTNSLAAIDSEPTTSDIRAIFNSAIGTTCSFPLVWYYGLDGTPPAGSLDFVSVVLHELGHGLGFQSFIDLASGAKLLGLDDVFSLNLENHSTGKLYPEMTDDERVSASRNSGNLHWVGPNVLAASGNLTAGVDANGHVQMYAPNPQQPGSSVSHFDTPVAPNELMEPFYTGATQDVGLALEVFEDLGWQNAPLLSDPLFVRQQYLDFLDREPEPAGLSAWVNALNNGIPRSSLVEGFLDSGEFYFKGKFIARTYLGILTRDAEYAGFRGWLAALLNGMSREQIVQFFLDSGEFEAKIGSNLTNSQFVGKMYANVLLRPAETAGFDFWVGRLNSGQMTRAQVALCFLDAVEFQSLSVSQNRVDVSLLYFDMLRRDPDPNEFSTWVEAFDAGLPLIMAIDAFLLSSEYQARFSALLADSGGQIKRATVLLPAERFALAFSFNPAR